MEEKTQKDAPVEGAKKKPDGGGGEAPPMDDKARIKELETENGKLKQQVTELQKRVQQMEAEQKSAANKARAQKLLRRLEKQGYAFASDDERDAELGRLAELSDEAFTATEAAFERALVGRRTADEPDERSAKPKAEANRQQEPLRTAADVRPLAVEDKKTSLEERLKSGFRVAYQDRLARTGAGAETD